MRLLTLVLMTALLALPQQRLIGIHRTVQDAGTAVVTGNGIDYHGGPVLHGTVNVYYIWYGNWSGSPVPAILENLARSIGGSPYFDINQLYGDTSANVSGSVSLAGEISVGYEFGTALTDVQTQQVVANAILSGQLPLDANGVYYTLTSADVAQSASFGSFCGNYCGYHSPMTVSGTTIEYAFVGDSTRCPRSCQIQALGPNGSSGADGMASVISHELEESATDPQLNAWYDANGQENADKCAWMFGTEQTAPNGTLFNTILGGLRYLIQENWINAQTGYCDLKYTPPDPNAPKVTIISPPTGTTYTCTAGTADISILASASAVDISGVPIPSDQIVWENSNRQGIARGAQWTMVINCPPVNLPLNTSVLATATDSAGRVGITASYFSIVTAVPIPPPLIISPTSVSLSRHQSVVFTANESGTWGTNCPSSLSSLVGNSTVYTAPGRIKRQTTCDVQVSANGQTASAVITLLP